MKILLDHNLDWRLKRHLAEHEVKSTFEMGWPLLRNGSLLSEAEKEGFTVLLTGDKNIKHQQVIAGRSIAVVVLRAPNNKLETHVSMLDEVRDVLVSIQPGELVEVVHPDMKP